MIADGLPGAEVISVTPPVALRVPDELMTTVPGEAPGAKVPKSRAVVELMDNVLTRVAAELTVPLALYWAKALGSTSRLEPPRSPTNRHAYPTGRRHVPVLFM